MTTIDPILPLSEEQTARLPKWARDHIHRMEMRDAEQADTIREMVGATPGAIAVTDPYERRTPVAWGRYDTVAFVLTGTYDEKGPRTQEIHVRRRQEGGVEISTPEGALQITAHSSNLMSVSVLDRLAVAR